MESFDDRMIARQERRELQLELAQSRRSKQQQGQQQGQQQQQQQGQQQQSKGSSSSSSSLKGSSSSSETAESEDSQHKCLVLLSLRLIVELHSCYRRSWNRSKAKKRLLYQTLAYISYI